MSTWSEVGSWLKNNAGTGVALVGSLLTGNAPGAIAAGISLVSSATGESEPAKVLAQLQNDPQTVIKLKELAIRDEDNIRKHIQTMEELRLTDQQKEHEQQQLTIRSGDNSMDEYVRRTRPRMARQSWYATMTYIIVFEALKAVKLFTVGAVMELAMVLISPAAAYMGFRTWDKLNQWRTGSTKG